MDKKKRKRRYIWHKGKKVYVKKEVYHAYYQPIWREAKRRGVRSDMETSYEVARNSGYEAVSEEPPVDEIVWTKLLLDKLPTAISKLTDEEQLLIKTFFFTDLTEREVADELGKPRKTLVYHRDKALSKLRKILENK